MPGVRTVLLLSVAALVWSGVSNLLLGDDGYLVRNLVLTALLLTGAYRAGWSPTQLGLGRDQVPRGVGVGLAAAGVVGAAVLLGVLLAEQVPLLAGLLADERAAEASANLLYETTLRIPLGTALFEEVLFRGVLLTVWTRAAGARAAGARTAGARTAGARTALVGSSVVFGLWHVAPTMVALELNGIAPTSVTGILGIVAGVVVTTIAGLLFAWLRRASGSLIAPILAHIATNTFGLLAAVATTAG